MNLEGKLNGLSEVLPCQCSLLSRDSNPAPTEYACPEFYRHTNWLGCLEGGMQYLDVLPQIVLHLSVRNREKCCFKSNPQENENENCPSGKEAPYRPMAARPQAVWLSSTRADGVQSIGCSVLSNKNILLLVKDLFNEHVHSRFSFWAPSHRTTFINSTLKTKWHESYCEYVVHEQNQLWSTVRTFAYPKHVTITTISNCRALLIAWNNG